MTAAAASVLAPGERARLKADGKRLVNDAFESAEDGEWTETAFVYCPNWLRFQYLGEVLESNLAEIRYLWNETGLSLEFDAEEIVELIEELNTIVLHQYGEVPAQAVDDARDERRRTRADALAALDRIDDRGGR